MAIGNITNGEGGLDVRNKLNEGIDKLNEFDEAEGKVPQGNGTGIESLSREDFGAQQELFAKSAATSAQLSKFAFAWDNVVRPNTAENSGNIGTTDNGLDYNHFSLPFDWSIKDKKIATQTEGTWAVVDRTGLGEGSVKFDVWHSIIGATARDISLVICKDVDNLIEIIYSSAGVELYEHNAGVRTLIVSGSIGDVLTVSGSISKTEIIFNHSTVSGRNRIVIKNNLAGDLIDYVEVGTVITDIFPLASDVKYLGFAKIAGAAKLGDIYAWKATNITRF